MQMEQKKDMFKDACDRYRSKFKSFTGTKMEDFEKTLMHIGENLNYTSATNMIRFAYAALDRNTLFLMTQKASKKLRLPRDQATSKMWGNFYYYITGDTVDWFRVHSLRQESLKLFPSDTIVTFTSDMCQRMIEGNGSDATDRINAFLRNKNDNFGNAETGFSLSVSYVEDLLAITLLDENTNVTAANPARMLKNQLLIIQKLYHMYHTYTAILDLMKYMEFERKQSDSTVTMAIILGQLVESGKDKLEMIDRDDLFADDLKTLLHYLGDTYTMLENMIDITKRSKNVIRKIAACPPRLCHTQ